LPGQEVLLQTLPNRLCTLATLICIIEIRIPESIEIYLNHVRMQPPMLHQDMRRNKLFLIMRQNEAEKHLGGDQRKPENTPLQ
jgi:hypothetical protein